MIHQPYTSPIIIKGKKYQFPPSIINRDGTRVWSVSVAISHTVAYMQTEMMCDFGKTADLGCGLGLIGMVVGEQAVLIEKDEATIPYLYQTLIDNQVRNRVIQGSWADVNEPFDSIIGSEVLYPGYDTQSLVDFVERNWTGKGYVIFANSRWHHFEQAPLPFIKTIKTFEDEEYCEWVK